MEEKNMQITDAEWKLMDIIWERETLSAKEIVEIMMNNHDWNKNTTYTVIKRLISKNVIIRKEPNFICIPNVKREEAQHINTKSFINKVYNGSLKMLFNNFLDNEEISEDDLNEIMKIIKEKQ